MKRSIPNIIANKILDNIENQPLNNLFFHALLLAVAIFASMAVIFPHQIATLIQEILGWKNGALVKTLFIFVLTFNFTKITQLGMKVWKNSNRPQEIKNTNIIEGIPTVELLDHLFEKQSFKREDIENKFGIPRNRYTTLAIKLESIGVLVRGENNARILNEEYSRADVAAILENVGTARELKKVFRQTGPSSFTNQPTAKGMTQKVLEAIQSTPSPRRFELHKLENAENA